MSNPDKPILGVNRLKSEAATGIIELLSQLEFASEADRAAFAAYLSFPSATARFLQLVYGGPGSVTAIDVSNPFAVPDRTHIFAVDTDSFYLYRLNDVGALPAADPPRVLHPDIPAGSRYWQLAYTFDYNFFGLDTVGRMLTLGGGQINSPGAVLFSSDTQRRNFFHNVSQWEPDLTGYTGGGAANLDGIPTLFLSPPIIIEFRHASEGYRKYRLRAGNDAHSSPNIIRPADYVALTNEKVWESLY